MTLAFPDHTASLAVAGMIGELGFRVTLASVAKFEDQVEERGGRRGAGRGQPRG